MFTPFYGTSLSVQINNDGLHVQIELLETSQVNNYNSSMLHFEFKLRTYYVSEHFLLEPIIVHVEDSNLYQSVLKRLFNVWLIVKTLERWSRIRSKTRCLSAIKSRGIGNRITMGRSLRIMPHGIR